MVFSDKMCKQSGHNFDLSKKAESKKHCTKTVIENRDLATISDEFPVNQKFFVITHQNSNNFFTRYTEQLRLTLLQTQYKFDKITQ